jgi:hypothetical protein
MGWAVLVMQGGYEPVFLAKYPHKQRKRVIKNITLFALPPFAYPR